MHTEQIELTMAMRENNILHEELLDKYSELRQRREDAEQNMSDGSINVAVSRMQTESNHTRQRIWYIITVLTLVLFSKFAFQPIKSVTSVTNTILITTIIVLFSTVSIGRSNYRYSGVSTLISALISLIVILYISLYIIHR